MIISCLSDWFFIPDGVDDVDAGSGIGEAIAFAFEYAFVAYGMQVGEAVGELDFFAVHGQASESGFAGSFGLLRQVVAVDAQEPAYAGVFELEETCCAVGFAYMYHVLLCRAKNPGKHIKEMNAYVSGYASAFFDVAFPAAMIPCATGGDVSKIYIVGF